MLGKEAGRGIQASNQGIIIFNIDNGHQKIFFMLLFSPLRIEEGRGIQSSVTGIIIFHIDNEHQEIFFFSMFSPFEKPDLNNQKVHLQRQ